jgi:hypothetical protein
MSEFIAETYTAGETAGSIAACVDADALAADQASQDGARVRLVGALFLPAEETCLYLYRSASADAVPAAVTRAGLRCDRLTPAVSITPAEPRFRTPSSLDRHTRGLAGHSRRCGRS